MRAHAFGFCFLKLKSGNQRNFVTNSRPFANRTSIIPTYKPIIKEIAMTTMVSLVVSCFVGQVTFLSSSTILLANPAGNATGFFIQLL